MLRDGSVSSHHLMVVRSLMFIFKALGLSCVSYLPKVSKAATAPPPPPTSLHQTD